MNILKDNEVLKWLAVLNDYANGLKEWDTDKEWVCESHPMMPFEQGLGFDCQCGGPGMSPYRPQDNGCPICGSTIVDGRCSDVGGNNCGYTVD